MFCSVLMLGRTKCKSVQAEGGAKVFAFVNKCDTKPKRRLYEVLKSQGLQMNQQVVFLSDGGDAVRDLQTYLSPESEHLLDWFHVTMRLTVMEQMVKGMTTELKPGDRCPETTTVLADMEQHLESVMVFRNEGGGENGAKGSGIVTQPPDCSALLSAPTPHQCLTP